MTNPIKVVLFHCDRCGKQDTLVAYHPTFGWYCKECMTQIRDRMEDIVNYMDEKEHEVNEILDQGE